MTQQPPEILSTSESTPFEPVTVTSIPELGIPAPERPLPEDKDWRRSYFLKQIQEYIHMYGDAVDDVTKEHFRLYTQLNDESTLAWDHWSNSNALFFTSLAREDLADMNEYLKIGIASGISPAFIEALYGMENAGWGTYAAKVSPRAFLPVFKQVPQLMKRYGYKGFSIYDADKHLNDPEHVLGELQKNAEYFRTLNEKYDLSSMTTDEYEKPVGNFCDGMAEVWIGKLQTGVYAQNPAVMVTVRPKADEYRLNASAQGFKIYQAGVVSYSCSSDEKDSYTLSPAQPYGFQREELVQALLNYDGENTDAVDEVLLDYITR